MEIDELTGAVSTDEDAEERGGRGSRRRIVRAGLLIGSAVPMGIAGIGSGIAGASATSGSTGGGASTGSTSSFPTVPGSGSSQSDWQSWSSHQATAMESIPWKTDLANLGCDVAGVTFGSAPADAGLKGAPAGIDTTTVNIDAKCPAGVNPSSILSGGSHALHPHIPTGNTCLNVTDGQQCVEYFFSGSTEYTETGYSNTTSGTIDGYEEMGNDGPSASSCSPGTQLGRNPSSGYMGLGSGYTAWEIYGPVNFDTVWDGTWWKGTGSYSDTGDVCTYI